MEGDETANTDHPTARMFLDAGTGERILLSSLASLKSSICVPRISFCSSDECTSSE